MEPQREITVPMGAILWSEAEQRPRFRLPQEAERLPAVTTGDRAPAAETRTCLELTRAKLTNGMLILSGQEPTMPTELSYT